MLEKQCRNVLHTEWMKQYNSGHSDISTLKRVKPSERNAFESLNGENFVEVETFKCWFVNFAWICCTLYPTLKLLLCLNMTMHQTPKRSKGGGYWTSLTTWTKTLAVNQSLAT